MHASALKQLATALEGEPWSVVTPIPPASQEAVDTLLARAATVGGGGVAQNGVADGGESLSTPHPPRMRIWMPSAVCNALLIQSREQRVS